MRVDTKDFKFVRVAEYDEKCDQLRLVVICSLEDSVAQPDGPDLVMDPHARSALSVEIDVAAGLVLRGLDIDR